MRHPDKRDRQAEIAFGDPWFRRPFVLAMAGGVCLFAAFPPLGLAAIVWIAPVFWLMLVQRPVLHGRAAWAGIWAASFFQWVAMLQGIRLAHWANYFGWLALAAYLALYLPVFVWLTRVAVHQLKTPLLLAAPVIWTGLELARGHFITGFSIALLGHTLAESTSMIQIADLFGAYAVSFLIMLVAAAIAEALPLRRRGWRLSPVIIAALALASAYGYGQMRLRPREGSEPADRPALNVALLQANFSKVFEYDPRRNIETFRQYLKMAREARDVHADLDLIVWPESVFTADSPELLVEGPIAPPLESGLTAIQYGERIKDAQTAFQLKTREVAQQLNPVWRKGRGQEQKTYLLVGTETVLLRGATMEDYNSALLISPEGDVVDRYYKMHPVMFGEYLPFGGLFPWIYQLTPLRQGLSVGEKPTAYRIGSWRLSPSICFESAVPHLIRGHAARLAQQHSPPDILVNVSDDGWFWGSSILDFQLACAVFRAVELRRPFLVAANAGLSVHVDGNGTILQRGKRGASEVIMARVHRDGRPTLYASLGDGPAGCCLAACLGLAFLPLLRRWRDGSPAAFNRNAGRKQSAGKDETASVR